MELTPKQERFCLEYLVDLNATQAAIRAGYSKKTAGSQGQRLLTKVEIQNRVAELKAERSKRVEVTTDMVVQGLVENWKRAAEAEPVLDKDGNVVGIVYQGSVVNKALELLGKHTGGFTDRVLVEDMPPVNITYKVVGAKPTPDDDDGSS